MARRTAARRRWSRCGCGSRRRSPSRVWTNVVSDRRVSRANASIVASSRPSASWTTARPLPASGRDVKTSSHVEPAHHQLEVEVARRASARTRAGRAPASPAGTPASPRARPRCRAPRRPGRVSADGGLGLVGRVLGGARCPRRGLDVVRETGARAARLGGRLRRGLRRSRFGLDAADRGLGRLLRGRLVESRARARGRSPAPGLRRLVRGRGLVGLAAGAGSRRAGPSASCSRRATSPGSAPWRRLSSRCSRIASSSSPMAHQP